MNGDELPPFPEDLAASLSGSEPEESHQKRRVSASELYERIGAHIRRYVRLDEDAVVAATVWIMLAHTVNKFASIPYLHAWSAIRGCGKTTFLDLLEQLVPNPVKRARMTAMSLARKVDSGCTILLDEGDLTFEHRDELAIAVTRIFNDGYRKGGLVEYRGIEFRTFGPKLIASIGNLPPQIADRALRLAFHRMLATDRIEAFDSEDQAVVTESKALREDIEAWASSFEPKAIDQKALREAFPTPRSAQVCRPLLQIALECSADVYAVALAALLRLCNLAVQEESSPELILLDAIRSIFNETGRAKLFSETIAERIAGNELLPFARGFDKFKLAAMLRKFGIRPEARTMRIGNMTAKGYERARFERTWTELLPPIESPSHPSQ